MTTNFLPGTRVRYTGPLTDRDCDAVVEAHDDPGKVALRLDNGALFLADPADCRPLGAPIVWPMAFPESAR